MYLSYSGFQKAEGCMYEYWHSYINHTPHGLPDDRLGSIFGTAIGRVFEQFYKERLWKLKGTRQVLEDRVEHIVDAALDEATKPRKGKPGGVILWLGEGEGKNPNALYASREDLIRDTKYCVGNGLKTIRSEFLISKDPKTELKLHVTVEGHVLGGYADFVMDLVKLSHRPTQRVIIDGKGARGRERYIKEDQLVWYALQHKEKFGYLPDRTAFLYWRFEPPCSMDWYEPTQKVTEALKHKVLTRISKIEKAQEETSPKMSLDVVQGIFKPKASRENCRFCPYATENICSKGFKIVEALKAAQAAKV